MFTIRDDIVQCIRYKVHFLRFSQGDSRHSWVRSLIEPRPSSPSPSLSLVRIVVTAVARCNDSGSLRKLPITLFYCMQVTEQYFSVRCCARFAEEKERGEGDKRVPRKVGTAWRRKEKENESKRA